METIPLRTARIIAGKSIPEAAEHVSVSNETMYRYETGKASPKIGTAKKLAKFYGRTVDEIEFGVEEGSE